ncbi:MAG: DEAD/DEAH box helicase family protein [Halieaceae bacterium]|nr:DEAD/DEAH box helicase family protein [Halieaceae bacterium]
MTTDKLINASHEIDKINQRLQALEYEQSQLLSRKAELESVSANFIATSSTLSPGDKVVLFQKFFKGRDDIHAFRWENSAGKSGYAVACHNEWQSGLCNKPKIKCSDCTNKAFKPLGPKTIYDHLSGVQTVGLYPLMRDDTCQLLVVDFDKSDWQQAAKAFAQVCINHSIPHAIERSRSGNGAHIWIFFDNKVLAREARCLGFGLLDRAMEHYPGLSFDSYDRIFPNQDSLPSGGFGNLIALPLQYQPRRYGNSVFVNQELIAYPDQWQFLSGLEQLPLSELHSLLQAFDDDSPEPATKPWEQGVPIARTKIDDCPARLKIVLANQIFIPVNALPSKLLARLKRQASFANPVFFKTQAMRFSTHGIPRYISLARVEQDYLVIPRGCLDDITQLLGEQDIAVDIDDKRETGNKLKGIRFLGELRGDQKNAVKKLTAHDVGILHAPTAFGKTVTAIGVIAKRRVNTLILTHTRQLVDQWKERLLAFLGGVDIGVVGGGKRKPTGCIDIATYQSLLKRKDNSFDPLLLDYGQVIIDECHHISAPNYDRLLSEVRARYVLGLTATPERQDGHQPIIFMQAGPIRHQVKANKLTQFEQRVYIRPVLGTLPGLLVSDEAKPHIADVYRWLMESEGRNSMIVEDICAQVEKGANPLVLTERREHAEVLSRMLTDKGYETVVLRGAMRTKEREQVMEKAKNAQILIATGKYIGEGFDLPRLDTLFLALPISWKGSLAQYAGRIHRAAVSKDKVAIYDYVDSVLPMLQRMFQRRCKGYEAMGYTLINDDSAPAFQSTLAV